MHAQVLRNIFREPLTLVHLNRMSALEARFRAGSVVKLRRLPGYAPPTPCINGYLHCIVLQSECDSSTASHYA